MNRSLAALCLSAALFASACGSEDKKDQTWLGTPNPTATTAADTAATDSATHPGSPGGTAVVPDVAAGTTVLVLLETNSIGMQEANIPKGPAVLTIENRSADVHNLFVEGPGVSKAAGDAIAAGQSASLEVTFQPGTYTFYCPLADHRQKGEEKQLTIAP